MWCDQGYHKHRVVVLNANQGLPALGESSARLLVALADPAMPRKFGYTHVLDDANRVPAQREALLRAGCTAVFVDETPASIHPAPQWQACIKAMARGDRLVVPALEQIALTLEHLAERLDELADRGIELEFFEWRPPCPLDAPVLAEIVKRLDTFERAGRRTLINAGLSAARAEGRVGGRRQKLTADRIAELKRLMLVPGADPTEVGKHFGLSRMSVYRYLKR